MADPKDPKDLNEQAPPDTQARPEKDQIAEEALEKVSGGVYHDPTLEEHMLEEHMALPHPHGPGGPVSGLPHPLPRPPIHHPPHRP